MLVLVVFLLLIDYSGSVHCPNPVRHGKPPPKTCRPPSDPNSLPKTALQKWFSRTEFNTLFPKANHGWGPHKCLPYSYDAFILASRYFPDFGTAKRPGKGFKKDELMRRDLAAFFAHVLQETGETDYSLFNSTLTAEESYECFYRGGLYHLYEGGPRSPFFPSSSKFPKMQPNDGKLCLTDGRYCNSAPETNFWYPCNEGNVSISDVSPDSDAFNATEDLAFESCYFGRGPLQLSWNYNYGQFQHFLKVRNVEVDLLNEPHLLLQKMDPPLAMLSAIWFYMTPQPPKPSMHDVIMGNWRPAQKNTRAGYDGSVFGPTSLIINNECQGENLTANEPGPPGEHRRIKAFKFFAQKLKAPVEADRLLSCKGMIENFDAVSHKFSWQPNWATMWKSVPCDCAPAPYPGALPYYDPKIYPEKYVKDNERNRLRCVYGMYKKRELYRITSDNSPCINHRVKIRLSRDGI